jgi:hypothetical protein
MFCEYDEEDDDVKPPILCKICDTCTVCGRNN